MIVVLNENQTWDLFVFLLASVYHISLVVSETSLRGLGNCRSKIMGSIENTGKIEDVILIIMSTIDRRLA